MGNRFSGFAGLSGLTGRPARVLVVDDDADVRGLLRYCLEAAGYEVVEAKGGRNALDVIDDVAPDLVLLDERMPGMGGREVLHRLRARPATETLPVIMVTGEDEVHDRVAGLDSGATDYVGKPFDPAELLARVRAHVRSHEAWQDVIAGMLAERTAVVEAFGRAARQPTAEATAQALCDEVASMRAVDGVALVALGALGAAVPLGCTDGGVWGLRTGQAAPTPLARYLSLRSSIGPWVEHGEPDGITETTVGALLSSGNVACAPLTHSGVAVGLLLLGVSQPSEANATLSAAIDFAQVAVSLLGPHLIANRRQEAERLDVFSVLVRGAFAPCFQPIVALDTGTVVGFEALTRFADQTPPEVRFAEAASVGLGLDLEAATINAALGAAMMLPERRWLSINVSPALLSEGVRLGEQLEGAHRAVVLELSEHDRVADYDVLRSSVGRLPIEVQLSVDDAGSGFASLRHVLVLEPSFMKLDRSWVSGIDRDPARQALIAGLHRFSTATGCRLIAEGIETEDERAAVQALGVELGQGYLFGRPAPASTWDEFRATPAARTRPALRAVR